MAESVTAADAAGAGRLAGVPLDRDEQTRMSQQLPPLLTALRAVRCAPETEPMGVPATDEADR
jgi:hypothetical protein